MILSVHAAFLCVVSWMFSSTWGGGVGWGGLSTQCAHGYLPPCTLTEPPIDLPA